jgi:hypothetical protein
VITAASLEQIAHKAFREPTSIGLQEDGQYDRVVDWRFEREPGADEDEVPIEDDPWAHLSEDSIPF